MSVEQSGRQAASQPLSSRHQSLTRVTCSRHVTLELVNLKPSAESGRDATPAPPRPAPPAPPRPPPSRSRDRSSSYSSSFVSSNEHKRTKYLHVF
ncbi:hypothetical protein E2C01_053590 [Portunus trituberculatus]|uniref:Uncharacterized protein n=1 Tax=Portunus trituberculatus TaxID=210409 RepID=A0A5B7GPU6_PORTR|nr:hypothetical protein [Portunus trituberculatus]